MRAGDLATVALDDWQRVLDVNLTGYLLCSQRSGPPCASKAEVDRAHLVDLGVASAAVVRCVLSR